MVFIFFKRKQRTAKLTQHKITAGIKCPLKCCDPNIPITKAQQTIQKGRFLGV